MRLFFLFAALLLLVLAAPVLAQSDDLSALTDQFDTLVPALLKQYDVPGASLALIRNGQQLAWSNGYGVADLTSGTLVTADTVFSVESIGKALTAWEIMSLVEAGKLNLDAPVNQYLTGWQVPALGRNDPAQVTIRRILSHTAGLSVDGYPGFKATDTLPTVEELLNGEGGSPRVQVLTPPGKRFSYSGGGYTILQLLIEQISGKPFDFVMQQSLLKPNSMFHSSFVWSPELNAATAYRQDGKVEDRVAHIDQAAGGLYTTANDLARFFIGALGNTWLKQEDIALMYTPAEATDGQYGFGYFLFSLDNGTPVAWHDGIGTGVRSIFFWLPQSGDGLIILTNKGNGNRIFREIVCAWDMWLHGDQTKLCQSY